MTSVGVKTLKGILWSLSCHYTVFAWRVGVEHVCRQSRYPPLRVVVPLSASLQNAWSGGRCDVPPDVVVLVHVVVILTASREVDK